MKDRILCINAGSSSLKFALYADEVAMIRGQISGLPGRAVLKVDGRDDRPLPGSVTLKMAAEDVACLVDDEDVEVSVICHRIVHGGDRYKGAELLSADDIERLQEYVPFAPLHQPYALEIVRLFDARFGRAKAVGCFDTAFHRTLPQQAELMALPAELRQRGIKRYGFHGLAYESVVRWLRDEHPALSEGKVVALHLGSGASLCALDKGTSVATTMGTTALDGVPMATRSGGIDPGALLMMLREGWMDAESLEDVLYRRSGLLGLSGRSGDMRVLRQADDRDSALAINHFVYRVAEAAASMMSHLGGADALVFSGGVGENDRDIRQRVAERLSFAAPFDVLVHRVDEEAVMVSQAQRILKGAGAGTV